jgi:hypothetical protein
MAAVRKLSRDVFASPSNASSSDRFGGPVTSVAKRKLFEGVANGSDGQQYVTINLPTQTENGEIRYVQMTALAVPVQQAAVASPTKMEPPRPKTGALGLFFRKVYHIAFLRMNDLCTRLTITDDDLKQKVWTCFELSLMNHTKLMNDRHLDQLLMCAIYSMCKVSRHEVSFQDIMKSYRLQPQSKSHIYRSVLLKSRLRRNSTGSERSAPSSPVADEAIRSSSTLPIPHPTSQPPTPTRLAGTGSQFDFGEERGDLIMFYNQVYVPEMKNYIMKFQTEMNAPVLSPMPRSVQNPQSPCRRISAQHKLFISPMKAPIFPPSPKRPMVYNFLRSPAKELRAINQMMRRSDVGNGAEKKPVSKRILQDDTNEAENAPAKRICTNPALFRSKIESICNERQGSVIDEDDSVRRIGNGDVGAV